MAKTPKLPREAIAFQPDAVEVDERRLPWMARIALYMIVFALTLGVVWASISEVDKLISATGRLVSRAPPLVIQPLETSVIRSIDVRVGDVVKKGQVLATLDPTFARSDVQQLHNQNLALEARIARLSAEKHGREFAPEKASLSEQMKMQVEVAKRRTEEHLARLDTLKRKKQQLEASLNTNRQDQHHTAARLKNAKDIESIHQSMFKQDQGSRINWLNARKDRLELAADLSRLEGNQKEIEDQLMAAGAELNSYLTRRATGITEELVSVLQEQKVISEQLRKAVRRSELVEMSASEDAVVLEVAKLYKGSVIKGAEHLITLIPLVEDLEAEVEIDARDIGRIEINRPARVKLDAWPFQRHGTLQGHVRIISGDAFVSSQANSDASSPRVVYRARIKLEHWNLRNVPEHFRPIPGLTLSSEIHVGTRRVIRYFFDPLIRALDESIREP